MKRAALSIAILSTPAMSAGIPAFPGAEGYGAEAGGGRGGDVYVVTNLKSSGEGSFYQGVTTIPKEGRTVVFAVSGEIHLAGGIKTRITGNKLTIAGQTAPGDGIQLRDGTLRVSGGEVVIRHLRIRHGKDGSGGDCVDLDSSCRNVILDHVAMSFSTDENFSSFKRPPENLTMQWSLNAWGLESHSCGGLWDQNHATSHHNLWAHNHTRNPKARPGGLLEWTNNITFDWDIGFIMGDSDTPMDWKANVIGNYFICPPGNLRKTPLEKARPDRDGKPNFSVHVSDNLIDNNGNDRLDGVDRGWEIVQGKPLVDGKGGNYQRLDQAVPGSGKLVIESPRLAFKKVVSCAGPLRLDAAYSGPLRDEVDTRLLENLVALRRNHISRESDLKGVGNGGFGTFKQAVGPSDKDQDGMPDAYESALGWNPDVMDHNSTVRGPSYLPEGTADVYTRLEEYLHFKSVPHAWLTGGRDAVLQIDLSRYTGGFTKSAKFKITSVTAGTVQQGGDGGKLLRFKPSKLGRGGFQFTVTDADGDTWTQQFAVCITKS